MKIFLLGFMGAGKSYWGRKLSFELQLPYIDLDEEIAGSHGMTVTEIFDKKGEDFFREEEKAFLQRFVEREGFVLSCGGGTPCFFDNMTFMNASGKTIWLNPSVEQIAERLQRKKNKRPLLAGIEGPQLLDFVRKKLEERKLFYSKAQIQVDPDQIDLPTLVQIIQHA